MSHADVDEVVARALAGLAFEETSGAYFRQGEIAVLPGLLPEELVTRLADEVESLRNRRVRKQLPGYKKSESVGWRTLREAAPRIVSLFRSASLVDFLGRVVDAPIVPAPDWDAHACAVYHYERAGDGIGFHYDSSWYRGARYTVLIGLRNQSSARLVCDLHTREPHRAPRRIEVATDPGTVVVFHGDKVWHAVTPLAEGERRTVLTLQYVTDPRMGWLGRLVTLAKDALGYFGFREVVRTWLGAGRPLLGSAER